MHLLRSVVRQRGILAPQPNLYASLTSPPHPRHTTYTSRSASQAPAFRTASRAYHQSQTAQHQHRKTRHALVDGPPPRLWDEEIRPNRPCKRETAKDEADVAAEIRFVGVDAAEPWALAPRGSHQRRQGDSQIGNDDVGNHTTQRVGPNPDTDRL